MVDVRCAVIELNPADVLKSCLVIIELNVLRFFCAATAVDTVEICSWRYIVVEKEEALKAAV